MECRCHNDHGTQGNGIELSMHGTWLKWTSQSFAGKLSIFSGNLPLKMWITSPQNSPDALCRKRFMPKSVLSARRSSWVAACAALALLLPIAAQANRQMDPALREVVAKAIAAGECFPDKYDAE